MEASKHTPGPWEYDAGAGDVTGKLGFSIPGSGGQDAWAIVARTAHAAAGNGPLIAAAPDLLAALDAVDAWLSARISDGGTITTHMARSARSEVRSAIAKARGQA